MNEQQIMPIETIGQKIFIIRGMKVMLGQHLAEIYQIPVRAMIQAIKRNRSRFPHDFMFQLTDEEFDNLKSQIVTSSWGGIRRAQPYAFTEHGIAMLSSVLKSPRAIEMNILIIRAFIRMREILASNKELGHKIEEIELESVDAPVFFMP